VTVNRSLTLAVRKDRYRTATVRESGAWGSDAAGMSGLELQRLGVVMEPEPGNPHEIEGVLNPAAGSRPGW